MELAKLFTLFFPSASTTKPQSDYTLYQIATHTSNYCGRIINQDDVVIRFQNKEGKPVKILKENIRSILVL